MRREGGIETQRGSGVCMYRMQQANVSRNKGGRWRDLPIPSRRPRLTHNRPGGHPRPDHLLSWGRGASSCRTALHSRLDTASRPSDKAAGALQYTEETFVCGHRVRAVWQDTQTAPHYMSSRSVYKTFLSALIVLIRAWMVMSWPAVMRTECCNDRVV